ncbi:MAG: ribosome-binding factor A [Bacteroidetes bacterium]|nr:MAG: ribosome-binding factor A [Bacteroidota bacterium]
MTSTRQHKVGRLLQKELGDYFQKKGAGLSGGKMVSVTEVRISPDLGIAKVYLSFFPAGDNDSLIERVREHAPSVRREMGSRLRNQLRHIPDFSFFVDDTLDTLERIDELLKN